MGTLNVMDGTGHVSCKWDPSDEESVKIAKDTFIQCRDQGARAFLVSEDGSTGEMIDEFDSDAGTILIVPALRGG